MRMTKGDKYGPWIVLIVAAITFSCAMFGCSAFDPKMQLARSHYDETDPATGRVEYCREIRKIRKVGDQIQVLAPHSSVWRDVPADRNWELIVWDWEDYSE